LVNSVCAGREASAALKPSAYASNGPGFGQAGFMLLCRAAVSYGDISLI